MLPLMAALGEIDLDSHAETRPRRPEDPAVDAPGARVDQRIAELASRQHWVVARWQLVQLGLAHGRIDYRVAHGRLHPVHRGVYAVGHPRLVVRGRWMAAVLAHGPAAHLSHRTAGAVWEIVPAPVRRIDVTVCGRRGSGRPGIVLHRPRHFPAEDRAIRDGFPVTSLPRTLLDLAAVVDIGRLERALEHADRLRALNVPELVAICERPGTHRGARPLMAVLATAREPDDVRSELERAFIGLCRRTGLPIPALNVMVEGSEVDALWPRERLIVELDSYSFHRSRRSFEDDRARDLKLQLAGYRVVRVTWYRLLHEPAAVAEALRRLLRGDAGSAARSDVLG